MTAKSKHGVFEAYANVYDALYRDKDYTLECDFLESIFRHFGMAHTENILDLGCGTGGHAIILAERGYQVLGVDRSAKMLAIAQQKAAAAELSDRVQLVEADIQDYRLNRTFDIVICMFAVLGYQTSNAEVFATLKSARQHVRTGGLFICDFWYGPAVLSQRPAERVMHAGDDRERVIRLVKPEIDTQHNVVKVHYDVLCLQGERLVEEFQESHAMRYFFKPEIEFFMNQAGFRLVHLCPFADFKNRPSEASWNVAAVSQAA